MTRRREFAVNEERLARRSSRKIEYSDREPKRRQVAALQGVVRTFVPVVT